MRLHQFYNITSLNKGAYEGFYNRAVGELWLWMIFCEWIYNVRHIFFTTYSKINDNEKKKI